MSANALQALHDLSDLRGELVYPVRDVAQERTRLYANDALSLEALSQYGWHGKRDLREGARILIVGEGNGDATVLLAEQARGTKIELIAIETSEAAIAVSKARLARRGLTNVKHISLSLLDLPKAGLGEFDIIECSHVLDHIENPSEGLAALGAVLKDDGLMVLTVNGNYGRVQIHVIQTLMQHLLEDFMPREMKIQVIRAFLSSVPADHWLGHDSADFIAEIDQPDGSGIDALFLQPYLHLFSAMEIYQWLDQCGLALTSFMGKDKPNYCIETHVKSPLIHELLAPKMEYERAIIGDLMHAGIRNHQFYAAIEDKIPAQFADEMIISFAPSVSSASELVPLVESTVNSDRLLNLIDGNRTVKDILAQAGEGIREELEKLYKNLHLQQRAFLRHQTVAPYLSNAAIQARLQSFPPITLQ